MTRRLTSGLAAPWRRLRRPHIRSPWLLTTVLLAAVAPLMLWAGGRSNRESFWVNVLAWAVTLLITLAVGSVAVPAYRARRRSAERRAALAAQHLLLSRLASHLAEQFNERYDLDRYVLYPVPPQGGPVALDDVVYYRGQSLLADEDRRDNPA